MNIEIHAKHLTLSPEQKEYIEQKLTKALSYTGHADDESARITVDVSYENVENKDQHIHCIVNMFVPKGVLRAESSATTVQAAVDMCEEKLKPQAEKYKLKMS